jgi:hypothetical protein
VENLVQADRGGSSWAEQAIEEACRLTGDRYRSLPRFPARGAAGEEPGLSVRRLSRVCLHRTVPGATPWGEPAKSRAKVEADAGKIARYIERGVCGLGYAIVFEEAG